MNKKIDDLENRSRRNNLVVYGVNEERGEDHGAVREGVVINIFAGVLWVKATAVERIHRVGKKNATRERPVVIPFYDFAEIMAVLRTVSSRRFNCICWEDFSLAVRETRQKLWQSAKVYRDNGNKVTLVYDKLKINKCLYASDHAQNKRVGIKQSHDDSPADSRTSDV